MPSTPPEQRRAGASTLFGNHKRSPSKTVPLKGVFDGSIWKCNCDPHLPASCFTVKKEGRTKGRKFYTCQLGKAKGCDFFLWDEDALKEAKTIMRGSSRNEPPDEDLGMNTKIYTSKNKMTSPGSARRMESWVQRLGKRNQKPADENDESTEYYSSDDFGGWISQEGEKEMMAIAEEAENMAQECPETPKKALKTSNFTTPGSKRKYDEGKMLPTPVTTGHGRFKTANITTPSEDNNDIFGSPSTKSKRLVSRSEVGENLGTPLPSRSRDAADMPEDTPTKSEIEISDKVLSILRHQNLPDDVTDHLKRELDRHVMKISGISRGRDISRIALKSKDEKIAELQQKIDKLEAERELDKTVIRHFKSDMTHSAATRGKRRTKG